MPEEKVCSAILSAVLPERSERELENLDGLSTVRFSVWDPRFVLRLALMFPEGAAKRPGLTLLGIGNRDGLVC